ncbi:MAG TPA: class I SAM-dependent methyltransferase, partial [Anaerolineales bacterium]|nr:class I SAM-dependent methyltransferase [Anaerolineales bacterium]
MKRILKSLFPGRRYARKILKADLPDHFHPIRSLFTRPPDSLRDLTPEKIEQINESSSKYYEDASRYNFWKDKPFSDPKWAPWFLWRFGLLLSAFRIRPGDRILDFGCGTGWTSIMLAQMGAEVLGLDVSNAALNIARDNASRSLSTGQQSRIRFEEFRENRIPVEDGFFDFVIVFEAIHHLPNPRTILREFFRVMNEYGYFGFAEPGIGHAATHTSVEEAALGILEEDLDIERLYRTALDSGFKELEILIPALSPDMLTLPMKRARRFLRGQSWLVPADFLRSAILRGPIGVFRKTDYPITSVHPKNHSALIRTFQREVSVVAGSPFVIEAEIQNPTDTVWLRKGLHGRGYVRLGA